MKSDSDLIRELKERVQTERNVHLEVLRLLQEVERRKLHLEMGYPDLYAFAQTELGYSSGAAHRRISAMRLLTTLPETEASLACGKLTIDNAAQAQVFFRKEDKRRKEQGEEKLSLTEKREVVTELLEKSTREGLRLLTERSPEIMTPTEKLKPLPENKTLVQFVASEVLMAKLEELKHLLAHQNYDGCMDVLVEKLADLALKKLRPVSPPAPGVEETAPVPATAPAQGLPASASRYIRVRDQRAVMRGYSQGCAYQDPKTGRTCGSRHGLQRDHRVPLALGGLTEAANLRLLCGAHNRFMAAKMGLRRPG